MKYISVIVAILTGAPSCLAAPTLIKDVAQDLPANIRLPSNALVKRDEYIQVCGDIWDGSVGYVTNKEAVLYNIERLRNQTGKPPTIEPGSCQLAICTSESGINLCTDRRNPHAYTVDNWGMIADAAQTMRDACSDRPAFDGAVVYGHTWLAVTTGCDRPGVIS